MYDALPENGTFIVKSALRRLLAWDGDDSGDARYESAKKQLHKRKVIGLSRGQGGKVCRTSLVNVPGAPIHLPTVRKKDQSTFSDEKGSAITGKKKADGRDKASPSETQNLTDKHRKQLKGILLKLLKEDEIRGTAQLREDFKKAAKRELPDIAVGDTEFWTTRDALIEEGELEKLRGGPGGSTRRPKRDKAQKAQGKEKDLYPGIEIYLCLLWAEENGYVAKEREEQKKYLVQVIKGQGRGGEGGRWTRPDLVFIAVRQYEYVPDKTLELVSFEVKRKNEYSIDGCFQTAAHSKFAHRSYLVIQYGKEEDLDTNAFVRLEQECQRFQVGLIVFTDENKPDTFKTLVECERKSPDPAEVDRFIASQLVNAVNKEQIKKWFTQSVTTLISR